MTADEVKRWLYGKEGKTDELLVFKCAGPKGHMPDPEVYAILESLAAARKLMKKHEHCLREDGEPTCPECGGKMQFHSWNCALASLVAGLPREGGEDGK